MIVRCPACRTRYRYHAPVPDVGGQAVCAKCEGLVPLVAVRQAYVVRAQVAAVPVRVPVGVAAGSGPGDPGPAGGLQETASGRESAADAPAVSYRVTTAEPDPSGSPFDHPVQVPVGRSRAEEQEEVGLPQSQPVNSLALDGGPSIQAQTAAEPQEEVARPGKKAAPLRRRGAGRRVLEFLAAVILAAAGAAAGEYATMQGWLGAVRIHPAVEPVRLGIVGGLLGVLIAWAGIRWTTRKS